ncbi:GNAT family N-acetyltransferase [Clostridium sp. P21]|uniref:GNAT family N-acetyltransferase n=1 Tax=Clostridium muellerianum TaxID=2716538 RepID=A0A7Y0HPL6_9CLOT|nr:GNAT family N-acetyltransferase [Clostridium muellerianum]NMM63151.1 GNAT family N-acetyltransferase [Clostridium muellerianum]
MEWKLKKFEELTNEELYKVLQLRNDVFIVEQQCPYEDCDGRDKESYHLFLEDKDNIVAYSRILKKGVSYDEVSIGRVVVNKNYRGKSIARELLIKAIKFIEETLKETEIRIGAQAYLIGFYESLGFKAVSSEYLEDEIPHLEMLYKKSK